MNDELPPDWQAQLRNKMKTIHVRVGEEFEIVDATEVDEIIEAELLDHVFPKGLDGPDHANLMTKYAEGRLAVARAVQLAKQGAARPMSEPPSSFLLALLMKPDEAKDAAANLEEYFPQWVAKYGSRRAARIFRFQTGRILIGYWWGRIMTQLERVAKTVSVFVRLGGN